MTRVLVVGGGVCGLATAMLLARNGNEVTLLEGDPQGAPDGVNEAWDHWDRKGVVQFRQPHNLHARCRHILSSELPDVLDALAASGASRMDPIESLPPFITDRGPRPGDERFWTLTGRRPMIESVFARAAENEPNVEVVHGVRVTGLLTGPEAVPGVPHVIGVETEGSGSLGADLVVDAMGRRSALSEWITAAGGRPLYEEAEDCGFTYYTRYFRSADGSLPQIMGPPLSQFPTHSLLTLPGDNGHWSVTVFTSTGDRPLKRLRDVDAWMRTVSAHPLHAHWLDGEPVTDVLPMSGVMDRYRRFVDDGMPAVTGLLAVADAWACTNPSAGRGISVGLSHAVRLRDVVRDHAGGPKDLAETWHEVTEAEIAPWYHLQVTMDRARVAEIDAAREGRPPPPGSDGELFAALMKAAPFDAEAFRAVMETVVCLALPEEIFARPGFVDRLLAVTENVQPLTLPGPSREELLALVA